MRSSGVAITNGRRQDSRVEMHDTFYRPVTKLEPPPPVVETRSARVGTVINRTALPTPGSNAPYSDRACILI